MNKVCFPGAKKNPRTDEEFRQYVYMNDDEYQKHRTLLSTIPNFGLVKNVVLDYMLLVCLGIVLKLIEFLINGPIAVKMPESCRKQISESLVSLKQHVPSDFSRAPRQLKNVRRLWKAHELRQFLLYTGPIVLMKILDKKLYLHFLCLHVAISILVNSKFCKNSSYINFADQLLKKFVKDFELLYGSQNVSHNVHNLLHLVEDARNFGPL